MKLELYSIPNCEEAGKFRAFLTKNNLPFREIITNTPLKDSKIPKNPFFRENEHTFLKITYGHSIHAIKWYDEFQLNQSILEHIKKYNAHVETW